MYSRQLLARPVSRRFDELSTTARGGKVSLHNCAGAPLVGLWPEQMLWPEVTMEHRLACAVRPDLSGISCLPVTLSALKIICKIFCKVFAEISGIYHATSFDQRVYCQ